MTIQNVRGKKFAILGLNSIRTKSVFENILKVNISHLSEHLQGLNRIPLVSQTDRQRQLLILLKKEVPQVTLSDGERGKLITLLTALSNFGIRSDHVLGAKKIPTIERTVEERKILIPLMNELDGFKKENGLLRAHEKAPIMEMLSRFGIESDHLLGLKKMPVMPSVQEHERLTPLMTALSSFGISCIYASKSLAFFQNNEQLKKFIEKVTVLQELNVSVVHEPPALEEFKIAGFNQALEDIFCKKNGGETKILIATEEVATGGKRVETKSIFILSGTQDLALFKVFTRPSFNVITRKYAKNEIVCPTPGSIKLFEKGIGPHISQERAQKIMDHWNICTKCQDAFPNIPKIFAEKFKNTKSNKSKTQ